MLRQSHVRTCRPRTSSSEIRSAAASSSADASRHWSAALPNSLSRAHPCGCPSLQYHCAGPNPSVPLNPQRVGTRRDCLSLLHPNSSPGKVGPILMRQGLVEQVNSSLERPFQSQGSCSHAHVVSLSLSPTDRVSKTRFLVQRLEPDRVLGLVADELVRQPRIVPKYQQERSVSASVEDAVLCTRPSSARFDPVPFSVTTTVSPVRNPPSSRVFQTNRSVLCIDRFTSAGVMLETLFSARNLA